MNIKEIMEDNIEDYSSVISDDVAENMERMYFRGLACHDDDDNIQSAIIWELRSVEKDADTEAQIECVYAENPDSLGTLLEEYHNQATDEDVVRTFFELTSLDDKVGSALGGCGFDVSSVESRDVIIPVSELRTLPLMKKRPPDYVKSIADLDLKSYHQGIMKILFKDDVSAMEDLSYIPKTWFEQDVSCYVTTDDKVNGFLLVHEFPSGILMPVLYNATGPDFLKDLAYMMIYSIAWAAKKHPDAKVLVRRRNKNVAAMVGKLFPGKKGFPAMAGKREE